MPVTCYLCGRDFGSKSIAIHVPNCIQKWKDDQKRLPLSQRLPIPQAPEQFEKVLSGQLQGNELKNYNEAARKEWKLAALVECSNCGRYFSSECVTIYNLLLLRTFFPHKLKKHQKLCTAASPMMNPNTEKGLATRLELLVSYPKKVIGSNRKKEQSLEESVACTCGPAQLENYRKVERSRTPSMEDIIDLIRQSNILECEEARKQLYFVVEYFIKLKKE